jgi:hypothetical protein
MPGYPSYLIYWGCSLYTKRLCNGEYRPGQLHTIQSSNPRYHWCRCTCTKTLLNFVVSWFTFTTNGFLFFFIVKLGNVGLSVDSLKDVFMSVWKQIYYSCTFQNVHINLYLIYAYRVRNSKTLLNFVVSWFTTNGFLFFFIVKLENVGLSVDSLNAVEVYSKSDYYGFNYFCGYRFS